MAKGVGDASFQHLVVLGIETLGAKNDLLLPIACSV